LAGFIGGLALLSVVAWIIINFYQILAALINFFFKDFINRHLIFRNLNPESRRFLETNLRYYQRLPVKDKALFEKRVQKFIDMKEFVPRGALHLVTADMKTLIAASAIQITFGLPGVYFEHFYRILSTPTITIPTSPSNTIKARSTPGVSLYCHGTIF
jgi:Mlc titration factor MtfA (ptsG expression regulator)